MLDSVVFSNVYKRFLFHSVENAVRAGSASVCAKRSLWFRRKQRVFSLSLYFPQDCLHSWEMCCCLSRGGWCSPITAVGFISQPQTNHFFILSKKLNQSKFVLHCILTRFGTSHTQTEFFQDSKETIKLSTFVLFVFLFFLFMCWKCPTGLWL